MTNWDCLSCPQGLNIFFESDSKRASKEILNSICRIGVISGVLDALNILFKSDSKRTREVWTRGILLRGGLHCRKLEL